MRLVAIADTHCRWDALDPLPAGDVLIVAGDLLGPGALDELKSAVEWLRRLPFRTKLLVAGNTEWCFLRDLETSKGILGQDVVDLEDEAALVEGLTIWGSPWQPEYDTGAFNLPRGEALADRWDLIPGDGYPRQHTPHRVDLETWHPWAQSAATICSRLSALSDRSCTCSATPMAMVACGMTAGLGSRT